MNLADRARPDRRNPWVWVPTLYMAEGIPYILVTTVSVILYKNLGISNTDIALYTSWLYLPWVIKPLWSPLVDMIRTKRLWIVLMQLLVGGALACVALTIPASDFFRYSLAFFWILAFSSATHDIAADGFYMLGLEQYQQAAFVGVRTIFYRIAVIAAKGILVVFAGHLQSSGFSVTTAWSVSFFLGAAIFLAFALYHAFVLPWPSSDAPAPRATASPRAMADVLDIFALFFRKKEIIVIIAFFLFYRFAEAQLIKMVAPFLLDPRTQGGLGLTTGEVGVVYGTVGAIALMLGGLLGGYAISRQGLKFWLWPMVVIMHLPVLVFVYLSLALPENRLIINAAVAVEQFGYGFGFTAYSLYMIMVSEGPYKTVHYALGTGIMALGMMIPGMTSGWLQERLGYPAFFLWISLSTIPGFIVAALVKIDPNYGRKA